MELLAAFSLSNIKINPGRKGRHQPHKRDILLFSNGERNSKWCLDEWADEKWGRAAQPQSGLPAEYLSATCVLLQVYEVMQAPAFKRLGNGSGSAATTLFLQQARVSCACGFVSSLPPLHTTLQSQVAASLSTTICNLYIIQEYLLRIIWDLNLIVTVCS